MDNYKIINTHTNEIIKALNDLGYVWTPKKFDEQDCLVKAHWILAKETGEIAYSSGTHIDSPLVFKELTLPQLRDLVVLRRNDVKDATHKNFRTNTPYLKQGENEYYMFNGEWVLSNCPNDLEPITKPQDPALISGAEAKLAWANGEALQINKKDTHFGFIDISNDYSLGVFDNEDYEFRLKPQTIKLELELPKSFEPKDGETYWHIYPSAEKGYHFVRSFEDDDVWCQFGAWRTEAEVKQVVEQLRKIRGTNS